MKVSDVMTSNVVTISSDTPVQEALKIMEAHNVRRLPVVDKGKLLGVVNIDAIYKAQPSSASSLSIWELHYLLAKLTVKEIMHKGAVTTSPDTNIEEALATAQAKKVGSMIVLEDDAVVGIITTNDIVYKVINPVIGVGCSGRKFYVENCHRTEDICEVLKIVNESGVELGSMHTVPHPPEKHTMLALRITSEDDTEIVKKIEAKGFKVSRVNMKAKA